MKTNKSNSKLKLNKSAYTKSKSKSKIKISISPNKSSYNIHQYIKNKNDLILSSENKPKKEDIFYNNIIEEKEKLINSYKTKLDKEKLINKNLWHELNEYKSAMNKARDKYNKIMNKKQTKNEELIVITNKLTKLIEMVINFSYSMAYLRSNIYSKNKKRFNESTLAYESLNNNLKQIYNEFEQMNKNLKSINDINLKMKRVSKSHINSNKNKKSDNINEQKKNNSLDEIYKVKNNIKINLNKFLEEDKKDFSPIINNQKNCQTEKKTNSLIKEENTIITKSEEKQNLSEVTNNLNSDLFLTTTQKEEPKVENNTLTENINYTKISNIPPIKNRDSIKKENINENNDIDKIKKSNPLTNSEKIFTFRNNSQISKESSEKINLADSVNPIDINIDIDKILEENKNLKMQLASEKLKNSNNIAFNNSLNESHNDAEYEEIINELKKKMEEKDKLINELQNKLKSKQDTNYNLVNIEQNKTENEKIFNNINVNVNLSEMERIKGNYQENINTIRNIYERMIMEKEKKIEELNNQINIIENDLEELNDKYDKEKENTRLNNIKIQELENEKNSLIEQIKNLIANK